MDYRVISADCHIDLPWLPPELFVSRAKKSLRERMPYVEKTDNGEFWVSRNGARFGLRNGMGSAGRRYVPGEIYRSDRMASEGLYSDGEKRIPRLTDPELRIRDQDRDGVQAEVLYGVLGASMRLNDDEASVEMVRVYNEWLAEFCSYAPDRFAGIASLPNCNVDATVEEIERVAARGVVRGVEIACSHDMKPLFDPTWEPVWKAIGSSGLPLHFHTIGPRLDYNLSEFEKLQRRQAFAVHITGFQMAMSKYIMEMIYGGVLDRHSSIKLVIGECGIGWIPYLLEHMDLEWRDQFADLNLSRSPSEYWHAQCSATYQSDAIGLRLLDAIGVDNVMWGSDFPHPDGVWPDSLEFISREFVDVSSENKQKVICDNAAKLYGFEYYRSSSSVN
ncbi:MAG: amidohydrolase family protein [Gammaproteobacteria bacterium]|nr:amidohydrolase family protein [Gammaproteobacteria bacterium]